MTSQKFFPRNLKLPYRDPGPRPPAARPDDLAIQCWKQFDPHLLSLDRGWPERKILRLRRRMVDFSDPETESEIELASSVDLLIALRWNTMKKQD